MAAGKLRKVLSIQCFGWARRQQLLAAVELDVLAGSGAAAVNGLLPEITSRYIAQTADEAAREDARTSGLLLADLVWFVPKRICFAALAAM
ncbi:MAG TPA: hypothetical protein VFN67_16985 [Polyangiales bacterium]|nr:hypothetical protein [Polyangiales bacterium]